jgi:hypothetical protein
LRVILDMADKLVVVDDFRAGFRIQWELDDGDDRGAFLGQEKVEPSATMPENIEDREYWACERAGFQVIKEGNQDTRGHDEIGFWWESQSAARAALTKVKAMAQVTLSEVPWPEWAKTALANGWKPPKGWKP